ncbi:MAG: M20 metallopeptidase family protein [Anaerolineae bacterium]
MYNPEELLKASRGIQDRLTELRRKIHQYPELGFQEVETARLVAQELRHLGLEVRERVGVTGVVGKLGNGHPCIALRADMDALPIQEENDVPYASKREGLMHACGHDAHVAGLLGAAMLLTKNPPATGQVRFLFQPSEEGADEEGKSGAARMIEDGAMEGVDAVVGLHTDVDLTTGRVGLRSGPFMAAADRFRIAIRGAACHAAHPHRGVDAIVLAAQAILAMQTVISRKVSPIEGRVITVGTIHGGVRSNVVAELVEMEGTIRSFSPEVRETLKAGLENACKIVEPLGGSYTLQVLDGYPVTVNNPTMTHLVQEVAQEMLGAGEVVEVEAKMGAEDFSLLAEQAPGCFFRLGVTPPGQPPRPGHSSTFDVDERALPVGAAVLAGVALRFLEGKAGR